MKVRRENERIFQENRKLYLIRKYSTIYGGNRGLFKVSEHEFEVRLGSMVKCFFPSHANCRTISMQGAGNELK